MKRSTRRLVPAVTVGLALLLAGSAAAAQVRFHFAPSDLCGTTTLKPSDCAGAPGTRVAWFGLYRAGYACQPRATHIVTFRHPYTARNVSVPVAFPVGTPRIEYRADRIIYNYGSYAVEAHFLGDGSVDVVYNAGWFAGPGPDLAY
jgi:hypothetical protein